MSKAVEAARHMRENAYRYSNGFGTNEGFIRDAYDFFGEGDYELFRDEYGLVCGGQIEFADDSVVRATTCCDWYGIVKGWNVSVG